jgi:Ca2+ transporting ATPase
MENAYTKTPAEALRYFGVEEQKGLSTQQVQSAREKHGKNALPEDPPTPIWELILEQFKDQLVIILLGSAAVSFVLALFEEEEGWTAFVDPAVVRTR